MLGNGHPRSLLQKTAKDLGPFQTKRNASETVHLKIFKKQESLNMWIRVCVMQSAEPNFSAEEWITRLGLMVASIETSESLLVSSKGAGRSSLLIYHSF